MDHLGDLFVHWEAYSPSYTGKGWKSDIGKAINNVTWCRAELGIKELAF